MSLTPYVFVQGVVALLGAGLEERVKQGDANATSLTARLEQSAYVSRLEELEARLAKLQKVPSSMLKAESEVLKVDGPVPICEGELKNTAIGFIRSELNLGNLTLVGGGMRPNSAHHDTCLKAFGDMLRREGRVAPPCTSKVFRKSFATVVKSERRKGDPHRNAKSNKNNQQRQWRWRLSERAIGVWSLLNSNNHDSDGKHCESALKGMIVLAPPYMPEIRLDGKGAFVWIPLTWLSDEAKKIQTQAFTFVPSKSSYKHT